MPGAVGTRVMTGRKTPTGVPRLTVAVGVAVLVGVDVRGTRVAVEVGLVDTVAVADAVTVAETDGLGDVVRVNVGVPLCTAFTTAIVVT